MLIKNHILEKNKLTLLSKDDTIETAIAKMEEGNFLSLPVVEKDKYIGYVMKEAIFEKFYNSNTCDRESFNKNTIEEFIETKYNPLDPDDSIDDASFAIKKLNVPFVPVVDKDGEFLGIVTHKAIFSAFDDIFNLGKGREMIIYIFNIPGQLSRLMNVFRKEGVNVENMVVLDAKVMGILKVICRVEVESKDSFNELVDKVEKEGFKTGNL